MPHFDKDAQLRRLLGDAFNKPIPSDPPAKYAAFTLSMLACMLCMTAIWFDSSFDYYWGTAGIIGLVVTIVILLFWDARCNIQSK